MLYRIYIPALEADGVSMTIDVEASNWMLALRYGLDEIGADRDIIKRAICDIKKDNSIHVMEPEQGRVFVLKKIEAHEQATMPAPVPAPAAKSSSVRDRPFIESMPTPPVRDRADVFANAPTVPPTPRITTEIPMWATKETEDVSWPGQDDDVTTSAPPLDDLDYPLNEAELEKYFDEPKKDRPKRSISHLDLQSMIQDGPRVLKRSATAQVPAAASIRAELRQAESDNEELFARVFEEMGEIDFVSDTIEGALSFALELAVSRIPSEAGWLLLSDLNRRDLYFATATGPKAEQVIEYRLPMGKGIAGFCAVNGVSLSLSDVDNDPRFQTNISAKIGYKLDSVACAPVQYEGRVFGAIQIMNKTVASEYTPGELDVLNYIAKRTGEYLSAHVEMA